MQDRGAMEIESVLRMFCASEEDGRSYLQKPFSFGEYSCASNGSAIVYSSIQVEGLDEANESIAGTIEKWSKSKGNDYTNMSGVTIPEPEQIACKECEGKGSVEFENDFNCYSFACKTCDGEGYFDKIQLVTVPGFEKRFDAKLMRILVKLKEVTICNIEGYLAFRFDNGFGVIANAREWEEE